MPRFTDLIASNVIAKKVFSLTQELISLPDRSPSLLVDSKATFEQALALSVQDPEVFALFLSQMEELAISCYKNHGVTYLQPLLNADTATIDTIRELSRSIENAESLTIAVTAEPASGAGAGGGSAAAGGAAAADEADEEVKINNAKVYRTLLASVFMNQLNVHEKAPEHFFMPTDSVFGFKKSVLKTLVENNHRLICDLDLADDFADFTKVAVVDDFDSFSCLSEAIHFCFKEQMILQCGGDEPVEELAKYVAFADRFIDLFLSRQNFRSIVDLISRFDALGYYLPQTLLDESKFSEMFSKMEPKFLAFVKFLFLSKFYPFSVFEIPMSGYEGEDNSLLLKNGATLSQILHLQNEFDRIVATCFEFNISPTAEEISAILRTGSIADRFVCTIFARKQLISSLVAADKESVAALINVVNSFCEQATVTSHGADADADAEAELAVAAAGGGSLSRGSLPEDTAMPVVAREAAAEKTLRKLLKEIFDIEGTISDLGALRSFWGAEKLNSLSSMIFDMHMLPALRVKPAAEAGIIAVGLLNKDAFDAGVVTEDKADEQIKLFVSKAVICHDTTSLASMVDSVSHFIMSQKSEPRRLLEVLSFMSRVTGLGYSNQEKILRAVSVDDVSLLQSMVLHSLINTAKAEHQLYIRDWTCSSSSKISGKTNWKASAVDNVSINPETIRTAVVKRLGLDDESKASHDFDGLCLSSSAECPEGLSVLSSDIMADLRYLLAPDAALDGAEAVGADEDEVASAAQAAQRKISEFASKLNLLNRKLSRYISALKTSSNHRAFGAFTKEVADTLIERLDSCPNPEAVMSAIGFKLSSIKRLQLVLSHPQLRQCFTFEFAIEFIYKNLGIPSELETAEGIAAHKSFQAQSLSTLHVAADRGGVKFLPDVDLLLLAFAKDIKTYHARSEEISDATFSILNNLFYISFLYGTDPAVRRESTKVDRLLMNFMLSASESFCKNPAELLELEAHTSFLGDTKDAFIFARAKDPYMLSMSLIQALYPSRSYYAWQPDADLESEHKLRIIADVEKGCRGDVKTIDDIDSPPERSLTTIPTLDVQTVARFYANARLGNDFDTIARCINKMIHIIKGYDCDGQGVSPLVPAAALSIFTGGKFSYNSLSAMRKVIDCEDVVLSVASIMVGNLGIKYTMEPGTTPKSISLQEPLEALATIASPRAHDTLVESISTPTNIARIANLDPKLLVYILRAYVQYDMSVSDFTQMHARFEVLYHAIVELKRLGQEKTVANIIEELSTREDHRYQLMFQVELGAKSAIISLLANVFLDGNEVETERYYASTHTLNYFSKEKGTFNIFAPIEPESKEFQVDERFTTAASNIRELANSSDVNWVVFQDLLSSLALSQTFIGSLAEPDLSDSENYHRLYSSLRVMHNCQVLAHIFSIPNSRSYMVAGLNIQVEGSLDDKMLRIVKSAFRDFSLDSGLTRYLSGSSKKAFAFRRTLDLDVTEVPTFLSAIASSVDETPISHLSDGPIVTADSSFIAKPCFISVQQSGHAIHVSFSKDSASNRWFAVLSDRSAVVHDISGVSMYLLKETVTPENIDGFLRKSDVALEKRIAAEEFRKEFYAMVEARCYSETMNHQFVGNCSYTSSAKPLVLSVVAQAFASRFLEQNPIAATAGGAAEAEVVDLGAALSSFIRATEFGYNMASVVYENFVAHHKLSVLNSTHREFSAYPEIKIPADFVADIRTNEVSSGRARPYFDEICRALHDLGHSGERTTNFVERALDSIVAGTPDLCRLLRTTNNPRVISEMVLGYSRHIASLHLGRVEDWRQGVDDYRRAVKGINIPRPISFQLPQVMTERLELAIMELNLRAGALVSARGESRFTRRLLTNS